MGELADRMETMRVRAATHEDSITVELSDSSRLSVSFREGYYRLFERESDMERQLRALAGHLWVARARETRRIFTEVTEQEFSKGDPLTDAREIAWREDREQLVATGSSADGRVTLGVVGFRDWRVSLRPGTLRTLDEYEFAAAVAEAGGDLIRELFTKLRELSIKHYSTDN